MGAADKISPGYNTRGSDSRGTTAGRLRVTASEEEYLAQQRGLGAAYVQASPEEFTRSYASPEWRCSAYQGGQRRDDGDDDSTHARCPERRSSACRAPKSKEAIEWKEETVKEQDAVEEATERTPDRDTKKT